MTETHHPSIFHPPERTSVDRGQLLCFYPARIFPGATPVSELPLGDQLLTNEYENVYLDWWAKAAARGCGNL